MQPNVHYNMFLSVSCSSCHVTVTTEPEKPNPFSGMFACSSEEGREPETCQGDSHSTQSAIIIWCLCLILVQGSSLGSKTDTISSVQSHLLTTIPLWKRAMDYGVYCGPDNSSESPFSRRRRGPAEIIINTTIICKCMEIKSHRCDIDSTSSFPSTPFPGCGMSSPWWSLICPEVLPMEGIW